MEKTTQVLKLLAALFLATTSGLRLAQAIRESVKAAEAEIADEDHMSDAAAKLASVMERAARQAEKGDH